MEAKSIDDVIARLEGIIEECIATRSRLGYFAALYNRVTLAVREGIRKGEFTIATPSRVAVAAKAG
ncbi:MAG TPA: DUF5995 family protein [Archangium sp.]|nr:DUF5995 family protein [Archangium sp.]